MPSIKTLTGLIVILTAFWVINSGYFKPLLLGLGILSVIFVILLSFYMKNKDGEFFPIIMPAWRLPGYLIWMMGQIILSNLDVAKRVWLGPSSTSPTVFTIRASQKTDVAKVLYANSITMTPGTVTLAVRGDKIEVHALTAESAESIKSGEMDKRVSALEGS